MKRAISLLLVAVMMLGLLAGCGNEKPAETTTDVAMQYIKAEEAKELLNSDEYVFFDIRKAADSSTNSIPGAQAWDMDAAKEGDAEAGKATMTEATKGMDKKIILVCYSGKRYAQAATNALSAIGYDMSKVYTLEGGFGAWSKAYPETAEVSAEIVAPASDVQMQYITPADALEVIESEEYVFFDVRKAEDYAAGHIPGALGYDMDAAKEGNFQAGVTTMTPALRGLDKQIILVCYSGKRYAQAATNVLSALGYDMSKVYTLEGGFTAWSEAYPDQIVTE